MNYKLNYKRHVKELDDECKRNLKQGKINTKQDYIMCIKQKDFPFEMDATQTTSKCAKCREKIVIKKYNLVFKHKVCMACVLSESGGERDATNYIG